MAIGGSASADACGAGEDATRALRPMHAVETNASARREADRFFIQKNARRFEPLIGGASLRRALEPQRPQGREPFLLGQ